MPGYFFLPIFAFLGSFVEGFFAYASRSERPVRTVKYGPVRQPISAPFRPCVRTGKNLIKRNIYISENKISKQAQAQLPLENTRKTRTVHFKLKTIQPREKCKINQHEVEIYWLYMISVELDSNYPCSFLTESPQFCLYIKIENPKSGFFPSMHKRP